MSDTCEEYLLSKVSAVKKKNLESEVPPVRSVSHKKYFLSEVCLVRNVSCQNFFSLKVSPVDTFGPMSGSHWVHLTCLLSESTFIRSYEI